MPIPTPWSQRTGGDTERVGRRYGDVGGERARAHLVGAEAALVEQHALEFFHFAVLGVDRHAALRRARPRQPVDQRVQRGVDGCRRLQRSALRERIGRDVEDPHHQAALPEVERAAAWKRNREGAAWGGEH